jgi:uncharacterized protein (TIGR02145 family)/uncharacterized repeat protein (TIGR02543 family)
MVKRGLLFGGIITFLIFCFSFSVYATDPETASTTFSIDVSNAALQVTAPATASIVLNPVSSAAVFGSTNITVNVATNNATGYTMTMTVPTTDLTHDTITGNDAPVIPTLASAAPQSTFPVNAWGYKVIGDNYNPVLLSNSNSSWITDEPTNGTDHIIGLAAKVDGVKHSGTYSNTLTFNVVTNPVPNVDIVSFNGNGADSGDMSGDNVIVASGSFTTLPANTYTKTNYRFIGWNTSANGTGTSYVDEGEYTSTATVADQNVTLYAMWSNLPPGASTSGTTPSGNPGVTISRAYEIAYTAAHKGMWEENADGSGYTQVADGVYHNRDVRWDMQGMTPEICNSVTATHDIYGALDIRDWHIYNITKTADGKCWLADNLALDLLMANASQRITTANTNADAAALTSLFSGNRGNGRNYATAGIAPWTSGNSYSAPMIYTAAKDQTYAEDDLVVARTFKYGVYYNFCAASAGSFCYGQDYMPGDGSNYGDAQYDICPTGWRLPTGSSTGEFQTLVNSYSTVNEARTAAHIPFSGNFQFYSGDLINTHTSGKFFTATWAGTEYNIYGLVARPDVIWSDSYSYLNDGYSVRCIAK